MEAKECIGQLRKALKPLVGAPSQLTPQQCLLRAASLRLVTLDQFNEAKSKHVAAARQRSSKEQWSALVWPAEAASQQDALEETAQARARPDFVVRRLKNKDQHQSCIKILQNAEQMIHLEAYQVPALAICGEAAAQLPLPGAVP